MHTYIYIYIYIVGNSLRTWESHPLQTSYFVIIQDILVININIRIMIIIVQDILVIDITCTISIIVIIRIVCLSQAL